METAYFRNIRKELIEVLKTTDNRLRIAVAWFTNSDLFDLLLEKLSNGIQIELVIIDDYINNGDFGLNFQEFIEKGGKLYYGKEENPMHHKFCVIDDRILFTGSYNWTYYAENKNFENVVKFEENQKIIDIYSMEFDLLIESLELVSEANNISFEEFESRNIFSIKNYLGLDLVYHGKEVSKIEYLEKAKTIIPENKVFLKEYKSFKSLPIVEQPEIRKTTTINTPPIAVLGPKLKLTKNSIGIKVEINGNKNRFACIIPKGTKIPCELSRNFIATDDGTQLLIETFKGENEQVYNNIWLGKFLIYDLLQRPKRQAGIKVSICIKENCYMIVKAKNIDTGNEIEAIYHDSTLIEEKPADNTQ
ncbi:phospholipase D-like domain-containing protein [Mariniflexile sp.]|uniref:phospholipase D-like domain-containing protein n=1 Tax=Mariniflexile sp. TaxID=1979402 RepID=UPI003567ED3C